MSRLLRLWFGLTEPVSRMAYIVSGFGLMALKYAVEAGAVHHLTGHRLTPLDYFNPLLTSRQAAIGAHDGLLAAMVVWTLPFLWIGVSMTMRRAEDAGRSPFLALLYFVPVVNYVLMLTLCLLPSRPRTRSARGEGAAARWPRRAGRPLGMVVGAGIAVTMVLASVLVFGQYGTVLFVATPFVMGAAAAYLFNLDAPRPAGATLLVAVLAVLAAGSAVLLFALEGLLCLAMAAPPAIIMACMGAALGRAIALRPARGNARSGRGPPPPAPDGGDRVGAAGAAPLRGAHHGGDRRPRRRRVASRRDVFGAARSRPPGSSGSASPTPPRDRSRDAGSVPSAAASSRPARSWSRSPSGMSRRAWPSTWPPSRHP